MKVNKLITSLLVVAAAAVADAGLWEGISEENHLAGPQITERDILGKVVLLCHVSGELPEENQLSRISNLWRSYDHNRFCVLGSSGCDKEVIAGRKIPFPVYKGAKLVADTMSRRPGDVVLVGRFGRVIASGTLDRDKEQLMVEAITEVGMPPTVIPGVTLEKYKSLKNKLKLGVNLRSVIKSLEKDVAAAEKKTANAAQKAKAEEASSILSAIRDAKSTISDDIGQLIEVNPEEAYRLLSQYVKSFPDEAAENKERLAELKVKAAEFKKQTK